MGGVVTIGGTAAAPATSSERRGRLNTIETSAAEVAFPWGAANSTRKGPPSTVGFP
jgi:hypothetical protein